MSTNQTVILDEVRLWFREAFKKHLLNERATWELIFQVQQHPETGQLMPFVVLYTQINAAQLNNWHLNICQVPYLGISPAVVERYVGEVLNALWGARSDALTQTNGHKDVPSQIILP